MRCVEHVSSIGEVRNTDLNKGGDLGIDGRIISERSLKMWAKFIWYRLRSKGSLF
jgi:hypothetical protein